MRDPTSITETSNYFTWECVCFHILNKQILQNITIMISISYLISKIRYQIMRRIFSHICLPAAAGCKPQDGKICHNVTLAGDRVITFPEILQLQTFGNQASPWTFIFPHLLLTFISTPTMPTQHYPTKQWWVILTWLQNHENKQLLVSQCVIISVRPVLLITLQPTDFNDTW